MLDLNYHNLTLLNQFAIKAKPFIGVVKISEMFSNEDYTLDILIKAAVTGELELVDLSRKISYESRTGFNLINAIASYIYNINTINSNVDFIQKTKSILIRFAKHLHGIKVKGATYRSAVEEFLLNVKSEDRTFSIIMARKFYRYWKAANKIADESDQINIHLMAKKKALTLLWHNIENEIFSHLEGCQLTQYSDSLLDKGLPDKDIILSSKITKIIMLELRNEHLNSYENYRDAIDRTQVLFKGEELEKLFLIVSREFHNHWLGNTSKIISAI